MLEISYLTIRRVIREMWSEGSKIPKWLDPARYTRKITKLNTGRHQALHIRQQVLSNRFTDCWLYQEEYTPSDPTERHSKIFEGRLNFSYRKGGLRNLDLSTLVSFELQEYGIRLNWCSIANPCTFW